MNEVMLSSWAGLLRGLFDLSRTHKRLLMLALDLVSLPTVMYLAIALKSGAFALPAAGVWTALALAPLIAIPVFVRIGLYRAVIRYMGPQAALAVSVGILTTLALLFVLHALGLLALPASTILIFGALLVTYVGASRMLLRWAMLIDSPDKSRVILYGAGQAGAELATALGSSNTYRPIAFVDDNPSLWGNEIGGLRIHSPADLGNLLSVTGAKRVLLALPSITARRRSEILASLSKFSVHVQKMPGLADLVAGTARVDEVQDVAVSDLLGRDPVPPINELFDACIRGKSVLVTGAGGSIGSELCRQILRRGPKRLLLLEVSEIALYSVERELRRIITQEQLKIELVALLGNAHHKYRVRELIQTFAVQTIYHAAAYKHVPIVEQNLVEGLHNNVFSTWHTAEAALECRVETFVLVSTDKAVRPTNVMGATKRMAEIVLQGLQQETTRTRFCMVRFGNVLESSGSVVPLFREQIRAGGPVTVTHPDVIRYFMTIPEAAQLVIQAGSMATGGDVFVLDMGQPVKIADLARRMIELSGLTVREQSRPAGDVEIIYTGLRPAEKLYEELLIGDNVTGTAHPRIMRAMEHSLPWTEVQSVLEDIHIAMRRFDCAAARSVLQRAVHEYQPTEGISDLVWVHRASPPVRRNVEDKVATFKPRAARPAPEPLVP